MSAGSVAARRAAEALVHAHGGDVRMEIPAPPVAGDDGEQMGLAAPQFQVHVVSPVAVRRPKERLELLVAADVLEAVLGVHGLGAVSAAMSTVYAAVVGDVRYRLAATECVSAMGGVCLYRLVCVVAGTEVV